MTKEKLQEFKDFLYEIEMCTGLYSVQEVNENTNILEYIETFQKEIKSLEFSKNKLNLIYTNDLNESSGKTYLEILHGFK